MNDVNELSISGPLPPILFLVALVFMTVVHFLVPLGMLMSSDWRWLGALFIVSGITLTIWAAQQFKKVGTAVRPTEPSTSLVMTGPFAFSRNPMYLGMVVVLIGVAVALGSIAPWLFIPLFVWRITHKFIVLEERKMESTFGEQYLAYKKRVRRWV